MSSDDFFSPSRSLDEWRQHAIARGQRLIARRRALQIAPVIVVLVGLGLLALPDAHHRPERVDVTGPTPIRTSTTLTPPPGGSTGTAPGSPRAVGSGSPRGGGRTPTGGRTTPTTSAQTPATTSAMLFSSDRSGTWRIYRLPRGSRTPVAITDDKGNATWPTWSPDGSQMAFAYESGGTATKSGAPSRVYIADADGTHVTAVTTPMTSSATCGDVQGGSNACWDSSPAWSPDGRHISFTRSAQHTKFAGCGPAYVACPTVWVVDVAAAGKGLERQVTTGRGPTWTPDGSALIVSDTYQPSQTCPECDDGELFRVGATGGNRVDLGVIGENARFSADGRHLVYWSSPGSIGGDPNVVVSDADATHGVVIGTGMVPAWDGDGTRVAVVSGSPNTISLIVVATHAVEAVDTGRPGAANDYSPSLR